MGSVISGSEVCSLLRDPIPSSPAAIRDRSSLTPSRVLLAQSQADGEGRKPARGRCQGGVHRHLRSDWRGGDGRRWAGAFGVGQNWEEWVGVWVTFVGSWGSVLGFSFLGLWEELATSVPGFGLAAGYSPADQHLPKDRTFTTPFFGRFKFAGEYPVWGCLRGWEIWR